jgi:hypothetical protein
LEEILNRYEFEGLMYDKEKVEKKKIEKMNDG